MTQAIGRGQEARRRWMGILAGAPRQTLEKAWAEYAEKPQYEVLRKPETGLAMVRGRVGGSGGRFNLGEMAVTRCAVQVGKNVGHSYVAGRDARHAELAAVFDGLLQDEARSEALERQLIDPLEKCVQERRLQEREQAASTRVNFFTMARGDD